MAYNKFIKKDGTVFLDLTADTVTEADVAIGKTFHKADGTLAIGTASGGTTEKDIFPTETIDFQAHPTFAPLYYGYLGNLFSLIAGETYYVVWGEDTFECVAQEATLPTTGETGIAMGNLSLAGIGEDTGEPFAIATDPTSGGNLAFTLSTDSTHTIRIYQKVSGGASADDRVKYVTYMDRGAELIKYPVIEGDTARDPVIKGYIEKPTKEPTVSTVYTQDGWSKTDGGAPDSTALQNVTEDRTVYAAFTESVRTYTVNFYDGDRLDHTEQVAYGGSSSYTIAKEGYIFNGWSPAPTNVTADMDCYAQWEELPALATMTWEEIAEISESGQAANYFAVGDIKEVHVSGKVGTLTVNQDFYVYIIGIDHEGSTGITFGTFKTLDGVDVALCDSYYNKDKTDGTKYFNMNHKSPNARNYGGWAGCDLRYDILGSTDVAPSMYLAEKTESAVGYDASASCATTPVANTLMAALPADLRAVMKPMTIYSDNVGAYTALSAEATASVDYLPLLAEFEVRGAIGEANKNEQKQQTQYTYFANGNSILKYKHSSTNTVAIWGYRSCANSGCFSFSGVDPAYYFRATVKKSIGIAPIFKV